MRHCFVAALAKHQGCPMLARCQTGCNDDLRGRGATAPVPRTPQLRERSSLGLGAGRGDRATLEPIGLRWRESIGCLHPDHHPSSPCVRVPVSVWSVCCCLHLHLHRLFFWCTSRRSLLMVVWLYGMNFAFGGQVHQRWDARLRLLFCMMYVCSLLALVMYNCCTWRHVRLVQDIVLSS